MKLRNKQTGEILAVESISSVAPTLVADKKTIQLTGTDTETGYRKMYRYESLAELNEEWEDVPEEEVWYLGKRIGNYSMLKKEADIVTEKILAWKRQQDKGFRFKGWSGASGSNNQVVYCDFGNADAELLNLLFGGEE